MGNPVVHFEVMGHDDAKLRDFYTQMFDWKFNVMQEFGYATVDPADNPATGAGSIGGGVGKLPMAEVPAYATFYVAVEDVEATLQKAVELGGTRIMGPQVVTGDLQIGMFTDPDGAMIGVCTPDM